MRYRIFVSDYDGTLASHGGVSDETIQALYDLKASNRKLILVTGRELPDLMAVFPAYGIFDFIIAEKGALIYDVNAQSEELLGPPPDKNFVFIFKRGRHFSFIRGTGDRRHLGTS